MKEFRAFRIIGLSVMIIEESSGNKLLIRVLFYFLVFLVRMFDIIKFLFFIDTGLKSLMLVSGYIQKSDQREVVLLLFTVLFKWFSRRFRSS